MDLTMTTRRAVILGTTVAALVLLFSLAVAGSAAAAPRAGITVARGVPAEVPGTPAGATFLTQPVTGASIAAPLSQREAYLGLPLGFAWAVGIVSVVLLIAGARSFGLAQRRGAGELTELARRRQDEEQRRRAA